MNIHFIGHSTFLLESGEHRLLIDPFIEGNPQATVTLAEAREWKLSAVLISHAHGDHWGNALDFARAGVPLIEIVTEPDLRSGEEAFAYLTEIRKRLRYLGICDGNMEEGSMRCDEIGRAHV